MDFATLTPDQFATLDADAWAGLFLDPPPTVTTASINTAGTSLAIVFSDSVTGVAAADFTLSGHQAISSATGSGTAWSFTLAPTVATPAVLTLSYTGTAIASVNGGPMATFAGQSVTNGSTIKAGSIFGTNLRLA